LLPGSLDVPPYHRSAAGKSHFLLSLSLSCQLPRLTPNPGGSIILTSERELPTDRLIQLAKTLLATHHHPYYPSHPAIPHRLDVKALLDNVHTNLVKDVEALDHALSFVIPALLKNRNGRDGISPLLGQGVGGESGNGGVKGGRPIRLLVIDSITALLRGTEVSLSSTMKGLTQRSKHLCDISDRLKALAVEYNLAIVVVNQVSDVFTKPTGFFPPQTPTQPSSSSDPSSSLAFAFGCEGASPPMLYATQARWFSGQSESLAKEASLGIVWANAVNTRIMLSRTGRRRLLRDENLGYIKKKNKEGGGRGDERDEEGGLIGPIVDDLAPTLIRRLHVVFSAHAASGIVDYAITPSGVHSIADSFRLCSNEVGVKRRRERLRREKERRGGTDRSEDEEDNEDGYDGVDGQNDGMGMGVGVLGTSEMGRGSGKGDDYDEYGGDVFDDLGDLPAEFWEGKLPGRAGSDDGG
jgi:DNA repair protein RAD57